MPGGGERVVCHVAGGLAARGVQPLVVTIGLPGALAEGLVNGGVRVESLHSDSGYDLPALLRLRRILLEAAPDVINVHDRSSLPYVVAANGCLLRRRPVVYTAHGLLFNADREPNGRYRLAMRRVSAMTAVSAQTARRHSRVLGWHRRVEVIPNGVPELTRDAADRRAVRAELGIGPEEVVFLAVGNARPEKGFEDLIAAAAALPNGSRDAVRVLVAGRLDEGDYVRGLREQIREGGLAGSVQLLGYRSDTHRLYAAADGFVLSSRSEGLPMVVLEAMMAGLPVLATDVGGVAAAVGEAGRIVPPRDPVRLARAMGELCEDPQLRDRLGSAAADRARRAYSRREMVDRYLRLFGRLTAFARGGGRR
jgi:glycosyltransferase involved in cell wall biosynthesis